MQVRLVEQLDEFDRMRAAWEHMRQADPHASVFLSWPWLRGWFETCQYRWLVLAARPDAHSPDAAYLPLSLDWPTGSDGHDRITTLRMAGFPYADYTGFLCRPEHEADSIAALARYVRDQLRWDRFEMREVDDPRLDPWLAAFERGNFAIEHAETTACPRVELAETWDAYLAEHVRPLSRQRLRRVIRRIEALDGFRVDDADPENIGDHIDTLFAFWRGRYPNITPTDKARLEPVLRRCFQDGILWLRTVRDAAGPLSALAGLLDRPRGAFRYFVSGFDGNREHLSAGTYIHCLALRCAIDNGCRVFDFLRGDEGYKFSFGAWSRESRNVVLTRKNLRTRLRSAAGAAKRRIARAANALRGASTDNRGAP